MAYFRTSPGEVAVHPAEESQSHELYFMCDDIKKTVADLNEKGVKCGKIEEARWGSITRIALPGGGKLGMYEPKHPMAIKPK
jgi:hypothetical protein